jgi:hypothetical protein
MALHRRDVRSSSDTAPDRDELNRGPGVLRNYRNALHSDGDRLLLSRYMNQNWRGPVQRAATESRGMSDLLVCRGTTDHTCISELRLQNRSQDSAGNCRLLCARTRCARDVVQHFDSLTSVSTKRCNWVCRSVLALSTRRRRPRRLAPSRTIATRSISVCDIIDIIRSDDQLEGAGMKYRVGTIGLAV